MIFKKFRAALIVLQIFVLVPFANATTFRVLGVQGEVLLQQDISAHSGTLGQATDGLLNQLLQQQKISEYNGSDAGVVSINNLGSANEVISDTVTNSYGWCHEVDGKSSDLNADQYQLTGNESSIVWFYAYAHYDRNVWTAMCTPADHAPAQE